jgi:hypothetical protein
MENVRFQVLTAVSMKMTAFWNIVQCSLIEVNGRFRRSHCLHPLSNEWYIVLIMEAVCSSETSVYFKETTRRYIPEGCHLD